MHCYETHSLRLSYLKCRRIYFLFFFPIYADDVGFSRADLECLLQNDPAHKACREELRQLKDEFECYKAKVQVMRKSRLESETDSNNKDTEKLKNQIKDLKKAVESLRKDLEDRDSKIDLLQERLVCEKIDLQKVHNLELESERTVYAAKMHELEKQMQNQRTRTMSLISEKDCEIERLKKKFAKEHTGQDHLLYTERILQCCLGKLVLLMKLSMNFCYSHLR